MSDTPINPDGLGGIVPVELPPPPVPISIEELLNTVDVIQKKESDDKAVLESIGEMSYEQLRVKLVAWAKAGFPGLYEILRITVIPPDTCSDGVRRNIVDYIKFCSGKYLHEHIAPLQEKMTGIVVGDLNFNEYISIVVSKV